MPDTCFDVSNEDIIYHYAMEKLVGFLYNNVEYIYECNIQGDILGIYKKNDLTKVAEYVYDAYGNHQVINYTVNNIGDINPIRYRGYYYDQETKLYYLNSRYYSPEIGRFISPDTLSILDETKAQINGLNLYMYCADNPVTNVDPSGYRKTQWWEWLLGGVVVAALVAGTVFTGGLVGAAFAGAAIGAGISLGFQAASGELNWGQFALDIGVGALTGLIGASGISRIGSMIAGTAIGGVSNFCTQLIGGTAINDIDWWAVGGSAIIGGLSGVLSGAGAKNKVEMDKFIKSDKLVLKTQESVAKVGSKMAKGLYATSRGAKSAYTQTMNRMCNAIFSAATTYGKKSLTKALILYGGSTVVTNLLSLISGLIKNRE